MGLLLMLGVHAASILAAAKQMLNAIFAFLHKSKNPLLLSLG